MGVISEAIRNAWRNYVTDGVPASGAHNPRKADIWDAGDLIDEQVTDLRTDLTAAEAQLTTNTDDIAELQDDVATLESMGATGVKWKASVAVATTANITLSGEQTIDGVLTSTDRVLVKDQTAPAENGIYASAAGAWARTTDADTADEITAAGVFVEAGTTQVATTWALSTPAPITLGTTALTFVKVAGIDQTVLENVLAGVQFEEVPDEGEYLFPINDLNDVSLGGWRWDGTFVAHKQDLGAGIVTLANLSEELQTQLLTGAGGSFAQNADYLVMGDPDDDGNYQITSQRISDGQAFALTSTNSNAVHAIDANDVVYYSEYVAGVETRKYKPAEGGTAYRVISNPSVYSWWGDSLTTNDYGGGSGVTDLLAAALDVTVNMEGVSGERSDEIKTRMLAATSQHEDTTIIWCGTNNRVSAIWAATVDEDVQAMVAILKPLGKRYLIMGALNGEADTTGTDNYTRTLAINADLLADFPDNFFDVRAFLMNTGAGGAFDVAEITPSAQDNTDISNGIVPASWRTDTVHLNEAGKTVVADGVQIEIEAKGWA